MSKIYVEIENEYGELARYKHHSNGRGFISATSVVHPTAFVESSAYVEPEAQLGQGAWVGAGSWIDRGAVVGAGVFIGAGVHVGQDARIGRGAKIGSHTRIGDRAVITDGMHVPHDTTIADGELVARSAPKHPALGAPGANNSPVRSADSGFAKAA
ncbi:MAG: transferase [Subtercola sp.]|nr:transferase [Subtercola sp.]